MCPHQNGTIISVWHDSKPPTMAMILVPRYWIWCYFLFLFARFKGKWSFKVVAEWWKNKATCAWKHALLSLENKIRKSFTGDSLQSITFFTRWHVNLGNLKWTSISTWMESERRSEQTSALELACESKSPKKKQFMIFKFKILKIIIKEILNINFF